MVVSLQGEETINCLDLMFDKMTLKMSLRLAFTSNASSLQHARQAQMKFFLQVCNTL